MSDSFDIPLDLCIDLRSPARKLRNSFVPLCVTFLEHGSQRVEGRFRGMSGEPACCYHVERAVFALEGMLRGPTQAGSEKSVSMRPTYFFFTV